VEQGADLDLAQQLEVALQKAELTAIETARPTPGAAESIAACTASGRLVAVVSNNYAEAVVEYLARAGLSEGVTHVEGRIPADPVCEGLARFLWACPVIAFSCW
jgi:phosphoglycolate phosphatase